MMQRPDDVVRTAYNLLLSREPEPAGLRHWSSELEHGMSRSEFIRAVLASAEFRELMAEVEELTRYDDVDLVIPIRGRQFRVPAFDRSLVPYLLRDRCWEPHVMAHLVRTLEPSSVFMDVGANLGYFTVLCAPLVSRVIAFEPMATTARYCEANIALNDISNVDFRRCGLWHEDATLSFKADTSSVMSASVVRSNGSSSDDTIQAVSLDHLCASGGLELERLDVIKMDIEGAELSALIGMRMTLERLRPQLIMEINRPMLASLGATIGQVWDFLRSLSYDIQVFEPWVERPPLPVHGLDALIALCPEDALVDIVAVRRS